MKEKEAEKKGFETPDKRLEKLVEEMEKIEDKEKLDQISKSLGSPPLLSQVSKPQDRAQKEFAEEKLVKIQKDMTEIKLYLKEILETLKSQEK